MKVAIPTTGERGLDEYIEQHFGRAPTFTIIEMETNEVRVIPNTSEHMGGVGLPPELLASEGIDVMLAAGLGRKAIMMFEERGIMVYIGASGTVKETIQLWQEGKLQVATDENACKQHGDNDHHHH